MRSYKKTAGSAFLNELPVFISFSHETKLYFTQVFFIFTCVAHNLKYKDTNTFWYLYISTLFLLKKAITVQL